MAFASPRNTPRTYTSNGAGSSMTPRTTEFVTTPIPGQYLWPSETDPNRAHWLRNEVIGFERVIVTLRKERDDHVEELEEAESNKEKARVKAAEIQRTVDELEEKRAELEQENLQQREIIETEEGVVADIEEAKELLLSSNKLLAARLTVLEKDTLKARETVTLQNSVQLQLQRHCVDTQSQLEELRSNPRVPADYGDHVATAEAVHKAQIAALQQELRSLLPQEQEVTEHNNELTEKLEQLRQDQVAAEQAVEEARQRADQQNQTRVEMEVELEELQRQYYITPARIEEREVVSEVTVEVEKDIVFARI